MKIIQIIARVNQGGTARWLDLLIPELQKLGHEVKLLAGDVAENENEDLCFVEHDGVRIKGLGRSISPFRDLRSIFIIRRYLKKFKPDVVNTHTAKAGIIGRLACLGLTTRVVHTYHGHLLYGYFSRIKVFVIIVIESILANYTTKLISVGKKVRDELVDAGIGELSQYLVCYPAIEEMKFISKESAREFLGIKRDLEVVGWLGRLVTIKNPQMVLKLAELNPNIIFLIGGTGPLLKSLQSQAPRNVIFAGWSDPSVFWPACDLALNTSLNEGLSTSLIESSLCGIPTIATDVGSTNEIVINKETGILVRDINVLSAQIRILINKEALRHSMGENARKLVNDHFSIKSFIENHLAAYSKNL